MHPAHATEKTEQDYTAHPDNTACSLKVALIAQEHPRQGSHPRHNNTISAHAHTTRILTLSYASRKRATWSSLSPASRLQAAKIRPSFSEFACSITIAAHHYTPMCHYAALDQGAGCVGSWAPVASHWCCRPGSAHQVAQRAVPGGITLRSRHLDPLFPAAHRRLGRMTGSKAALLRLLQRLPAGAQWHGDGIVTCDSSNIRAASCAKRWCPLSRDRIQRSGLLPAIRLVFSISLE